MVHQKKKVFFVFRHHQALYMIPDDAFIYTYWASQFVIHRFACLSTETRLRMAWHRETQHLTCSSCFRSCQWQDIPIETSPKSKLYVISPWSLGPLGYLPLRISPSRISDGQGEISCKMGEALEENQLRSPWPYLSKAVESSCRTQAVSSQRFVAMCSFRNG